MPKLHALELLPDEAGEAVVRRGWQALHDAGLPSMLDHTGGTNTPHVTVLACPVIDDAAEALASELLAPLLPVRVEVSGLLVLGGERTTLARLLDVPDEVVAAVLRLRAATSGHQHHGWVPHVTFGRRITRADLPVAMAAVGHAEESVVLTSLRRWDPEANAVRAL